MSNVLTSTAIRNLPERERKTFLKSKMAVRGLLFRIHADWSSEWSLDDDALLDAVVDWLEGLASGPRRSDDYRARSGGSTNERVGSSS